MTSTNKPTQITEKQQKEQRLQTPQQKKNEPVFEVYDPVDVRGVWLGQEQGYQWHPGCYVLHREIKKGQWWYMITRPYQGNNNITQLSYPIAYPSEKLRKTENPTPLKVTGGIYKANEFLQQYGASLLKNALKNSN
ncbi:MAG: hypothetical protein RIB93_18025 [Coleofasciculus sp. D1-CHI-01]|uniref:hypothetical protein n=1 Tax=Coleofasciculus sp. D1-CHI-01 TaxID=3068482 RepID=UPI0032F982F0